MNQAREAMEKYAEADPPPSALILKQRFDLSDFELDILLLCTAMELDTGTAGLCARAHNDRNKAFPTYALALALFPSPAWDALSPERPLRFWRLLEIAQAPGVALTASPLRADERIVNFLKGLNHLDDRLTTYLMLLSSPEQKPTLPLPPSHASIAKNLTEGLKSGSVPGLVHLLGPDQASKQQIAREVANGLSTALYLLPAAVLPASPAELDTLARTWRREALLLPVGLYLDAKEAERDTTAVTRFLSRSDGLIFLDTRENWRNLQREALTMDIDRPTRLEQLESWRVLLNNSESAAVLASQFSLSQTEIYRAAAAASHDTSGGQIEDRLWQACRVVSRPKLDLLAQRLDAKATWDAFVLPTAETNSLREVCTHARQRVQVYDEWGFGKRLNRGLGLSALFSGESGTGKTMAAEVIANELKLNLYRIDLSAVVSKYIGETEKRICDKCSMPRKTALPFCSSMKLTPCSASAAKSRIAMTAMPISKSITCCNAWSAFGPGDSAANLKNSLDSACAGCDSSCISISQRN